MTEIDPPTPTMALRLKAAELIERDGWHQGEYIDVTREGIVIGRCMVGALRCAANPALDRHLEEDCMEPVFDEVLDQLIEELGLTPAAEPEGQDDLVEAVASWNDYVGRSGQQVVAALRGQAVA